MWLSQWNQVIPLFNFTLEVRKLIYTTNSIEALNRSIRKVIKTRTMFPTDDSVYKLVYLAIKTATKDWSKSPCLDGAKRCFNSLSCLEIDLSKDKMVEGAETPEGLFACSTAFTSKQPLQKRGLTCEFRADTKFETPFKGWRNFAKSCQKYLVKSRMLDIVVNLDVN